MVEPSDAVIVQSDYRDLLSGSNVERVADNTYGMMEYVDGFQLDEALTYHGHCHQKALGRDRHVVGVLRRADYAVDPLDSTCCGMAGSFGYEAKHYSMSRAIGRILFDRAAESPGDAVVAPGASCRTQLSDRPGTDGEPPHSPGEARHGAVPIGPPVAGLPVGEELPEACVGIQPKRADFRKKPRSQRPRPIRRDGCCSS